ncbi:hypothetical protein M0805_008156 [Coniferiporia weirii]|nr:hypothetical protein M0805_008156 [Coniferiporia weirii]
MVDNSQSYVERLETFKKWFSENGGELRNGIDFVPDASGFSVHTLEDLPSDTTVVSCPFSLAITLETTCAPLESYCRLAPDKQCELSERQRISSYIALHWIIPEADEINLLRHRPYINMLPKPETLLTPLYFTEDELSLFKGTNLYGATVSQRDTWEAEWRTLREAIRQGAPLVAERFRLDMYLAVATYISSRSFPSTLLSHAPSLVATPSSYPVLLPGVDSLNHARNQPVTWGVSRLAQLPSETSADRSGSNDLCVSLTLNAPPRAGAELFNNYGPKPNASFILGYGFALPDNPDDTIMLKIGTSSSSGGKDDSGVGGARMAPGYGIGRGARGADELWDDVRQLIGAGYEDQDVDIATVESDGDQDRAARELQLDMETAGTLSDMVSSLLSRLPLLTENNASTQVRREVQTMWKYYVRGQIDILETLLAWLEEKDEKTMKRAEELGIDVVGDTLDE